MTYLYKTTPRAHQARIFEATRDLRAHALFHEQRTGKTKIVLDTAAYLYQKFQATFGEDGIDALLVCAPAGVHLDWVLEAVPEHLPDWTNPRMHAWHSQKEPGKGRMLARRELLEHAGLIIITINVEAIVTKLATQFFSQLYAKRRVLYAHDEASDVKSPGASRSLRAYALGRRAKYKRILEGTPIAERPLDAYGQLKVLTDAPMGFTNFLSFKHHYATWEKRVDFKSDREYEVIANYQNLDEFSNKLEEISSRVLRSQCADLPPKIYAKRHFELTGEQRQAYEQLRTQFLADFANGDRVSAPNVLARLTRLQQITCGFAPTDLHPSPCPACDGSGLEGEDECPRCEGAGLVQGSGRRVDFTPNPRVDAVMDELEKTQGQTIVWCRFRDEAKEIQARLQDRFYKSGMDPRYSAMMYIGGLKPEERASISKDFQEKRSRILVCTYAAARGFKLPARNVIYCSNGFPLRLRLQSEDRAITLEDTEAVSFVDVVAADTVDEKIVQALREKKNLSDLVLRDPTGEWI